MGSMEHPVFSLSTKPDTKPREYRNGDTFIKVTPSVSGLATVHDRDILIYCISQCMAALNEGRTVQKHMRFSAHDMLVATNRQTSGRGYELLKEALTRLRGTTIETNIQQGGQERFKVFGLIDGAEVVRETRDGRMQEIEITLSDWVFDAIENEHVLTLNKQYFQLRKPLERRIYELARKHCGKQPRWDIGLERLQSKAGSTSTEKEFKRMVTQIIKDNQTHQHIPDYDLSLSGNTLVVRPKKKAVETPSGIRPLNPDSYDKARSVARGWDVRVLEAEWRDWVHTKGIAVRDPDKHFIRFCEKRGPYQQEELF